MSVLRLLREKSLFLFRSPLGLLDNAPNILTTGPCDEGYSVYLARQRRSFVTSTPCYLKEIQVRTAGNVTTVEGIVVESDRKNILLEVEEGKEYCPLCPHRLNATVQYTDVLIISQFLRSDGRMLPRTVTGLCYKAQFRLQRLVHQAQRAGLMPELRPEHKSGLPRDRVHSNYKWRKYNTYFDE